MNSVEKKFTGLGSAQLRVMVLLTHCGLMAGLLLWSQSILGAMVAAVLLIPLPGLWQGRSYTYAWASLLLTFYCAALLAEGVAMPAKKAIAWSLAGIAALEFSALILYVRLQARARAAAAVATALASPAVQKAE